MNIKRLERAAYRGAMKALKSAVKGVTASDILGDYTYDHTREKLTGIDVDSVSSELSMLFTYKATIPASWFTNEGVIENEEELRDFISSLQQDLNEGMPFKMWADIEYVDPSESVYPITSIDVEISYQDA